MAGRAGKSQQWLSARLHGRSPIYADDIYLLAKGLQCEPCDFYTDEVEPQPIPSREDRDGTVINMVDIIPRPIPPAKHRTGGDFAILMQDRYGEMLTAMGIDPEDSDIVIATAEFLRQRRLQGME